MSARRRTHVARRQVVLDEEVIGWLASRWPGKSPNKAMRSMMVIKEGEPALLKVLQGQTLEPVVMPAGAVLNPGVVVQAVPGPEGSAPVGSEPAEEAVAAALGDAPKEDGDAGPAE